MKFGAAARRLGGIAGWLLGWRPDEFWQATPLELEMVLRAASGEDEAAGAGVDRDVLGRLMEAMPDRSPAGATPTI